MPRVSARIRVALASRARDVVAAVVQGNVDAQPRRFLRSRTTDWRRQVAFVCAPLVLGCGNPLGPGEGRRLYIGATGIRLAVGDTMTLAVTLDGRRETYRVPQERYLPWPSDAEIRWVSSSPNVVSVDQTGKLTATGIGRAVISVESLGLRDSGTVVVHSPGTFLSAQFPLVSAGGAHSCAIDSGGKAYCWGGSWSGELGTAVARKYTSTLSPAAVAIGQSFTQLDAGELHTCALDAEGQAYCWGDNLSGHLGDGTTTDRFSPVRAASGRTFRAIGAGADRTCGLTSQRTVMCWGSGWTGEAQSPSVPFASVSTGTSHTCALDSEGRAYCWGFNGAGQLGSGTTVSSAVPVEVVGGSRYKLISAGLAHTCAITLQDAAYCWGSGLDGRLGNGSMEQRNTPTPVSGDFTFAHVSAGGQYSCGVTTAGAGYCWGWNLGGQLGTGRPSPAPPTPPIETLRELEPAAVQGGLVFSVINAGPASHTCGVTTDRATYCWGANGSGALGYGRLDTFPGTTIAMEATPVRVAAPQ